MNPRGKPKWPWAIVAVEFAYMGQSSEKNHYRTALSRDRWFALRGFVGSPRRVSSSGECPIIARDLEKTVAAAREL